MKVFIMRHAHSVGNDKAVIDSIAPQFDLGLSEKGTRQAEALINTLNAYTFDVFIVSPLTRTIDTIQPYLDTLSDPKVIINTLTLERDAGSFIGKPLLAIKDYCEEHNIKDMISFTPQGGESILDVYARAKEFLTFLKNTFNHESILICGHKNFLACLEILINNKDIMSFYSLHFLENGEIREFSIH